MICLYVDDLRPCPEGWDVARTFHQAITMLENNNYDQVSLDHDLGCFYGNRELTGDDVLQWLIDRKLNERGHVPNIVHVHTANPAKKNKMLQDVNRIWGNEKETFNN